MITLEEAKRNQQRLHEEASKLLTDLKLKVLLNRYGQLIIEGSYAYELMHKPDIDLRVVTNNPSRNTIAELTKQLYGSERVLSILTMDMYQMKPKDPPKPKGYYIGLKALFDGAHWNVDIWLVEKPDAGYTPYASLEEIKKLSTQDKDRILLLKAQLDESGFDYNSSRVYRAVLESNIATVQDFEKWSTQYPQTASG